MLTALLGLAGCSLSHDDRAVGRFASAIDGVADAGADGMMPADPAHSHAASAGDSMEEEDDAGTGMPPDPPAEHCAMDMPSDPRDVLPLAPVVQRINVFTRDVLLPKPVIEWMDERGLQQAHGAWHSTRRWDDLCGSSFAQAEGCGFAQDLLAEQLWREEFQQGAPGSGSAFLHMHRHMIGMLKAAFPRHLELFAGFKHVPRTRGDAENPTPWKNLTWSDDNLLGFDILEHIEDHLDLFPSEDELGVFIESNYIWTPEAPVVGLGEPGAGTHAAMHNQWAVRGSPGNLGSTATALPNFSFWKLHGFIDEVWTRYRLAKGLSDDDPEFRAAALRECKLMYYLTPEHRAEAAISADLLESEKVRPSSAAGAQAGARNAAAAVASASGVPTSR